jgi:energy-coupling factor transporter transmembrane protein EcfT
MFDPSAGVERRHVPLLTKVLVFLILVPTSAFLGRWLVLAVAGLLLLLLLALLRINVRGLARHLGLYLVPLAAGLAVLTVVATAPGIRLAQWALGTARFATLLAFGLVFTMSTSPFQIPQDLMELGVPHRFGVALMIAYRLVPMLRDRLSAIVASQRARGASYWRAVYRPLLLRDLLSAIAIPAVYSTLDISLALSDTLYVRGYRADRPVSRPAGRPRFGGLDCGLYVIGVGLLLLSLVGY